MKQNELLLAITKQIPRDKSLIDVIASVLDISYASAHRRTSKNAKLSIDEAIKLAKYFNLSLDLVFNVGDKNIIPVEKTQVTSNVEEFNDYFKVFSQEFKMLTKIKDASSIYCAKDLPATLTAAPEYTVLTKFKIFVWLKLLNPSFKEKTFSKFIVPNSIKKNCAEIASYAHKISKVEIWDTTTINSTLKQVLYYNSLNHITNEEAIIICKEIKETILVLKKKATPESNYKLYYTELLLMGNKFLIKTPSKNILYLQYTAMNYFKTSDTNTCNHTMEYVDRILESCKLINTSSEKERDLFFNKMLNKVDSLHEHILKQTVFDF